jgi:glycosyltransferase involved in cell wall biosynthesis
VFEEQDNPAFGRRSRIIPVPDTSPSSLRLQSAYGAFDPEEREEFLREWLQGYAPIYCCSSVPPGEWPGEWLHELAALMDRAARLPPFEEPHLGPWELWQRKGQLSLRAVASPPQSASAVLYPRPESAVGVYQLWQCRRTGAREVWFLEADGWKQCYLPALFAYRFRIKVARCLLGRVTEWLGLDTPLARTRRMLRASARLGHPGPPEILHPDLVTPRDEAWSGWIRADNQRVQRPVDTGRPLKVVQYIGSLEMGGGERQMCNTATALARRALDVRVLTTKAIENEYGHYHPLLRGVGITARQVGAQQLSPAAARERPWHLLRAFPYRLRYNVLTLAADLTADPPDVIHCWLDPTNLIGGVAGLLAGVPAVLLGLRSLNPTQGPQHLDVPYLQPWYRILALSRRVHFVANSRAAAASYAEWIGIPQDRIAVIANGFEPMHFPQPTLEARCQARRAMGLSADHRVVSGIFRLSEEKQPQLFLDVVRRVRASVPKLRVLLAGNGPLEEQIAQIVRSQGMADYVRLLGRRTDVGAILLASDAALLTSRLEGCPNVALEAQHLGVPMVATAVGGTPEVIVHGETGFLAGVDDVEGLARHLSQVLRDDALRARLSAAGRPFIAARFGVERMVNETLALYRSALGFQKEIANASARSAA